MQERVLNTAIVAGEQMLTGPTMPMVAGQLPPQQLEGVAGRLLNGAGEF